MDFQDLTVAQRTFLTDLNVVNDQKHVETVFSAIELLLIRAHQSLEECTEKDFSKYLKQMIFSLSQILDQVCAEIPRTHGERDAFARQYIVNTSRIFNELGIESPQRKEQIVYDADQTEPEHSAIQSTPLGITADELAVGLARADGLLSDLCQTLHELEDDEIEEIAAVGLSVSKLLVKGACDTFGKLKLELLQQTELTEGSQNTVNTERKCNDTNTEQTPTAEQQEQEKGHLWNPVAPRLLRCLQLLVENAKKQPLAAAGMSVALAVIPLTWLVLFSLPPVLICDMILQKADCQFGLTVASGIRTTKEVAYLWFLLTRIFMKRMIRLSKKSLQRAGGFSGVCLLLVSTLWFAVTHPITSSQNAIHWSMSLFNSLGQTWYRAMESNRV